MSISIATLNVNGMVDDKKRNAIFHWCKNKNIDIACLQETHCSAESEFKWRSEWGGPSIWNNGTSASRGVGFLFKENFSYNKQEVSRDGSGRKLAISIKFSEKTYLKVYNIYCPNGAAERKEFIRNSVSVDSDEKNCIVGDFNCTLSKTLDRRPIPIRPDIGAIELQNFIENNNLIDIWRKRYPFKKRYTFSRGNSHSRIDYIFISEELDPNIENVKITHFPYSDHDGVIVKLKIEEQERGPGSWKLNNSILNTELFRNTFETFWKFWRNQIENFEDIIEWWELSKIKIRSIAIDISKKLNIKENDFKKLENELENILENDPDNLQTISSLREKIKLYYNKKSEAARIRSKVNWYEKGEKSTKYIFGLEKKAGTGKKVDSNKNNRRTV